MNTEELTPIVTAHQNVSSRHDQEIAAIRATLQEAANHNAAQVSAIWAVLNQTTQQQALNQEMLNQFTAGMLNLRNQVADYIQSRSKTE